MTTTIPANIPAAPVQAYHQTHRVSTLLPCPLCHQDSLIVSSFGRSQNTRTYYVTCEAGECEGEFSGPHRRSVAEAAQDCNEALLKFARKVLAE